MDGTQKQYILFNIIISILGGIILSLSVYMGLKNYYGIIYFVPTGAMLFALGILFLLISLFLFIYKEYWNVIKEIIYQRIIIKYSIFWLLIIGFFAILFLSSIFFTEIHHTLRSLPVFPIQAFEFLTYLEEPWITMYSIILRYTIGLWVTVTIWYLLINKILNRKKFSSAGESSIESKNTLNNIQTMQANELTPYVNSNQSNIAPKPKIIPNTISLVKRVLLNKYVILLFFAFLLRFIVYFNAYPGYDTGLYLFLVKDVVQTNNFSIFFGNQLSVAQQGLAFMSLPTCIPLIGFTYLTGGDPLLAASIYIPLLSVIVIYLTSKILMKATNSKTLSILTAFFLAFSVIQLTLISGLYKQLTTISLTLLIIYFLFFTEWRFPSKSLLSLLVMCFLIVVDAFYFLSILILLLILVSYLLIKRQINWTFLKTPRIFSIYKFLMIVGLIVVAGGATYLYYKGIFPFIDLSIFYNILSDFITSSSSSLFSALYNDIYLFAPFIIILIFAFYGFIMDHRKNHFINKNLQLFLKISFITLLILVLSDLFGLTFSVLDDRFLIFFEFVVVIYASIGIVEIHSYIKLNFSSKAFFRKSRKIFVGIFIICVALGPIISIPYFRFGKLAESEKEAINWLLNNGNTGKLTNDISSDVVVVANHHLEYWIQYLIHFNAINTRMYWKIGMILNVPINQFIATANETIYFLVSRLRAPSGETWNDIDILDYILQINTSLNKNYYLIYDNPIVYIYEIEVT